MKKFLAILLSVLCLLTFTGCPKDDPVGNKVKINFIITDGGIGYEWLDKINERFEIANAETVYGTKTGVYCDITTGMPSVDSMDRDGYHVYFFDRSEKVSSIALTGQALNITDIVTEDYDSRNGELISIEDKIPEEYRNFCKDLNGNYYAVPYTEVYGGLSYDKKLFDDNGLYFAKPDASEYLPYTSQKFGLSYNLVIPNEDVEIMNANKSCGPDGEYGTTDDGLPSSLYELLFLCDYMKSTCSIHPFQLSGEYLNYANFFMDGLMTSLQGKDRAYSMYSLDGEIEVVTGFTNENLIGKIDYLKKPITKVINITEETGYYTFRTVEQYYAEAMVEIIEREGYWTPNNALGTHSHITSQEEFIYSGYGNSAKIGMLIEASYWNNESTIRGNFDSFYALYGDECPDREIAWMALPVNIANSITGQEGSSTKNGITETVKGEVPTLIDTSRSAIVINRRAGENPEIYAAIKDWVKHFNSDAELSNFTIESGMARPLNYKVTVGENDTFNFFRSSMWDLRNNAYVLRYEGNNETFSKNYAFFGRGFTENMFLCHENNCILKDFRKKAHWTVDAFEWRMLSKADWEGIYCGNGTVTSIEGAEYVNGNKTVI